MKKNYFVFMFCYVINELEKLGHAVIHEAAMSLHNSELTA